MNTIIVFLFTFAALSCFSLNVRLAVKHGEFDSKRVKVLRIMAIILSGIGVVLSFIWLWVSE